METQEKFDRRKHFRIDTEDDTVMYPVTGEWTGQRQIKINNLCCGGVSFYTNETLQIGETVEIVLATGQNPLIVRAEIMREDLKKETLKLYAAKFINLIAHEEDEICKMVFAIQRNSFKRK